MKRFVPVFVLCGAVAGALSWWLWLRNNPQENALRARALATRGLAEHLAKAQAGRRVLVISNPFIRRKGADREILATEAAGLRGLREGFGSALRMEAPVFPSLKPAAAENPRGVFIDPETTTPLSYLVAEDAFDTLAAEHPDCDLIVSLIGLPAALDRVQCWRTNGPPRFALLFPDLRVIGDAAAVGRALKTGKLAAFVLPKPGAPDSQTRLGRDPAAEFEKRFVLVTGSNIDQVVRSFPKLFPAP